MSQTICFDVVCLECASTPCIFGTPTNHQGGCFWHEMSTLAPLSDLSCNAVGPIFCKFIHNGSVTKTAKFQLCIRSNLACGSKWQRQSNLPGHYAALELRQRATKV